MESTDTRLSLETLERLIAFPSVSRTSNVEVSEWLAERLRQLGFDVEQTDYSDRSGVKKVNLVACRGASSSDRSEVGGLAYFCHTDVVPADDWSGPGGDPFRAVITDDKIYGRGACDMKGSLAAMLAAAQGFQVGRQTAPLWIVCTADEEVGFEGAKRLVSHSPAYRQLARAQPACIIGEPTRLTVVHAHKGIEAFRFTSRGSAAHSSTGRGVNANLAMVPMLNTLLELEQLSRTDPSYQDSRFDPPTLSWTFGVSDGCHAVNITPPRSVAWLSFRTMPEIDGQDLVERVRRRAEQLGLEFERLHGGQPLWVDDDSKFVREMVELTGTQPHTVSYSTDGGQFTDLNRRIVCGPGDIGQAHTSDEWLALDELRRGIELYARAIERWCGDVTQPSETAPHHRH